MRLHLSGKQVLTCGDINNSNKGQKRVISPSELSLLSLTADDISFWYMTAAAVTLYHSKDSDERQLFSLLIHLLLVFLN